MFVSRMNRQHYGALGAYLVLSVLLTACGGGGEASSSPAPANPPPVVTPPAASVSLSSPTLSRGAATGDPAIDDVSMHVYVQNPPSTVWYRASSTGIAVRQVSLFGLTNAEGSLRITLWPAGQLGAGTHTATVRVEACAVQDCSVQLPGSPVNLAVQYVVTGSALPLTRMHWDQAPIDGLLYPTQEGQEVSLLLGYGVENLAATGIYVGPTSVTGDLVNDVIYTPPDFTTDGVIGHYTFKFRKPAELGSGTHVQLVSFHACFDRACTQEVPGSVFTARAEIVVPASVGSDFQRKRIQLTPSIADVTWSATDQSLYVAYNGVPGSGTTPDQPSVLRIDPGTLAIQATKTFPGEAFRTVMVPGEGGQLYLASSMNPLVRRLSLPSLTENLQIPLGDVSPGHPMTAGEMLPIVGSPQSFLAAVRDGKEDAGVRVYDGASLRPGTVAGTGTIPVPGLETNRDVQRTLAHGANSSEFLSVWFETSSNATHFDRLTLSATGITRQEVLNPLYIPYRVQWSGGRLYASDMTVRDPLTVDAIDNLPRPPAWAPLQVVVDERNGRVLVLGIFDFGTPTARLCLIVYDKQTLKLLEVLRVHDDPFVYTDTRLVLWGSDGVAVVHGANLITLSGRFFSSYDGTPSGLIPATF